MNTVDTKDNWFVYLNELSLHDYWTFKWFTYRVKELDRKLTEIGDEKIPILLQVRSSDNKWNEVEFLQDSLVCYRNYRQLAE